MSKSNKIIEFAEKIAIPSVTRWLKEDENDNNANNELLGLQQLLEQAQKQEQLLELYKELITVKNDMLDCCKVLDDDYFDIREIETELQKQIEKLEREIGK